MTRFEDTSAQTEAIARRWFAALASGDVDTALLLMADDIEFINYNRVPGYNTDMPWIGTHRGRDAVTRSFLAFGALVEVKFEELVRLVVQGNEAAGVIHERSTVKTTGVDFEIEFVQWLTVEDGRITRWKSYTDPSEIIRALRGDRSGVAA